MMAAPRLSYCAQQVQKFDNDRFLCALFAPPVEREALAAIGAFNIELARIREHVHQPLLGHMRLRWWSDVVEAVFTGTPPQHPVATALADAVSRFRLSRQPFDRMLAGRAADLDDSAPQSLAALIEYAEATSGALAAASLQVLATPDEETQAAAQDVAIAWTLVGLVRAVPFHARARRIYLPADLSREAGLDVYRLFDRGPTEGLRPVVKTLVDLALERLDRARQRRRGVAAAALPVLLPARLADHYIDRLRSADFDPFEARVRTKARWPMLRLTAAWLGRRF